MTKNETPQFSRLDTGFARFFADRSRYAGEQKNRFEAVLLRLSAGQAAGHSCISLAEDDEQLVADSGLVSSHELKPLILERKRLYTQRYWHYEKRLAEQLTVLGYKHFVCEQIDEFLERYFPVLDAEPDYQKQAAYTAITQGLTIITGGPGTGKTTTVLKILALLQEVAEIPLHIALTAPTGKAAMRLQESIAVNKDRLPCTDIIRERIPENVSTLHRLLGARPPTPYFNHSAEQPLPYDLVVIDESSMVDLALMSKLVDALKPGARLILLGDKDQLASVESGAVLADLTRSLPQHTVELLKSHRFQGNIKILADTVNHQQAEAAWEMLNQGDKEVALLTKDAMDFILENYRHYLRLVAENADFSAIYSAFSRFQVLCANQHGRNSVSDVNSSIEAQLAGLMLVNPDSAWYAGRPVMITRNNHDLKLFNGDIGLCLADKESDGQLRVFFLRGDGSVKKLQPAHLPVCETVFAMTIHKSQGSEFEQVLIMLPDQVNPVLSKELLYTAITRAKTQVGIVAKKDVFLACVGHRLERHSGLADKLLSKFETSL